MSDLCGSYGRLSPPIPVDTARLIRSPEAPRRRHSVSWPPVAPGSTERARVVLRVRANQDSTLFGNGYGLGRLVLIVLAVQSIEIGPDALMVRWSSVGGLFGSQPTATKLAS
jgi:hypothetical protein